MDSFKEKLNGLLADIGKSRKMVLSTSVNDRVSSRMMSIVQIDGEFYFQTDINLRKYSQLRANPFIALCADNIQIEGECREISHPTENAEFCKVFGECFKGSYDAYTGLKNERLFAVCPKYIERWIYKEGVPYIERFDIPAEEYSLTAYFDTTE